MWQPITPRSLHVSQLEHADNLYRGSGLDDCGPASITRYRREAGSLDPRGDIPTQLSAVAAEIRGHPDDPSNGVLSVSALQQHLARHGITAHYTESYAAALAAAWSVVLVDAYELSPAPYPQNVSWLGWDTGQGNHFILWLPQHGGSPYWFNDPLAWDNHEQDSQYTPASIQRAFRAALLLPSTGNGEDGANPPHPPAPAPAPVRRMVSQACGLLPRPVHGTPEVLHIPQHGQLLDLGVRNADLAFVQYTDKHGWVQSSLIVPVA